MAVHCRGCGREYAAARFELGRTLWCTCGRRVGVEPENWELEHPTGNRFAADAMLGRLARWLRLLGLDCAHDAEMTDEKIVQLALSERRTLLTRDRRLSEEWWIPHIYVVRDEHLREQLVDVIRRFELASSIRVLTRCSECNRPLSPLAPRDVSGRVPPRVLERHDAFSECGGCGRVYWEGTHAARIRAQAERLVGAA